MNKLAQNFLLKTVSQGYEEIALSFNETRQKPMKPMVYEIVNNLKISNGDQILDLGCGNGCFFEVLINLKKDISWKYLGLDNSSKLIKLAQDKYGSHFEVFDLLDLASRNELKYNYIFSWAVWHHFPGKKLRKKILNDVYNQLQLKGYFIFSVWKLRQRKNFFFLSLKTYLGQAIRGRLVDWGDLLFRWKGGVDSLRYYHAFSLRGLKKLIRGSDFKLEQILEDNFNYYCILKK